MKKNVIIALTFFMALSQIHAQESKSLVTVTGEGKVKVVPDEVSVSVSVVSKGVKATDVKKANDSKIDAVLKYLKKMGVAAADFQTKRVSLNDQYDYEKKKHNYVANQSIQILLRDLSKYDEIMEGLVDAGINKIEQVEFQSSKIELYKSEVRKLAVQNAKVKAQDYAGALGQKIGAAYTITENSADNFVVPRYAMMEMKMVEEGHQSNETLAPGEIEITANVSVSFFLFL